MTFNPPEPSKTTAFEWHNHLGLLIGAAASTLICLKLLAVANWNSTTAFGILSASGTANVLTGTLLAVLPMLYGLLIAVAAPRIVERLKRRNPAERGAVGLLGIWPVILLFVLIPSAQLLGILAAVVVVAVIFLVRRVRARRPATEQRKPVATGNSAISRFEALSLGLAGYVFLFFGTLAIPWVPAQMVVTSDGEQVAYVLKKEGDTTVVLLAEDRILIHLQADAVTEGYCERDGDWWNEPVGQLFRDDKYPDCPE